MRRTAANPFTPRTVLGLLLVGALALLVLLYAIGAGLDGRRDQDGGSHAAANGLNGYAGLVQLLQKRGEDVSLARSEARLDDEALLILTPGFGTDPEKLAEVIDARRYQGPTLVILPKWYGMAASQLQQLKDAKEGWVVLSGASPAEWLGEVEAFKGAEASLGKAATWQGLGLTGKLPDPKQVEWIKGGPFTPLVTAEGRTLAAYWQDDGAYPVLAEQAGVTAPDPDADDDVDGDKWAVVVVAEPDLLNNYALADQTRARMAVALVQASKEGQEIPIVFDLTFAGLGRSENLLTLAFEPPFLAATLCLLLAALVVGWRAFRRFGPPQAGEAAAVLGKRQLAVNGAALIQRTGRWHLLGGPYAALVETRVARQLALRAGDEAALLAALDRRGLAPDYSRHIATLRRATRPADLLRAAAALRTIERTLIP